MWLKGIALSRDILGLLLAFDLADGPSISKLLRALEAVDLSETRRGRCDLRDAILGANDERKSIGGSSSVSFPSSFDSSVLDLSGSRQELSGPPCKLRRFAEGLPMVTVSRFMNPSLRFRGLDFAKDPRKFAISRCFFPVPISLNSMGSVMITRSSFTRSRFSCPSAELCDDGGLTFPFPFPDDSVRPRREACFTEFCSRSDNLSGVRLSAIRVLFDPVAGWSSMTPILHSWEDVGVNIPLLNGEVRPICVGERGDTGEAATDRLNP